MIVVLTTFPDLAAAQAVAAALVEERLAACVQILPGITSHYIWQGKQESSAEVLMLAKSTPELWPTLRDRIKSLHPYEVPEIVALPVAEVETAYLNWVRSQLAS